MASAEDEKIYVELLIRMEGSAVTNRVTTFEMPIKGRTEAVSADEPQQVQFESRVLVRNIKKALDKLI